MANTDSDNQRWFLFIIFYLIVDIGRPQFFLPIGLFKPGMIATLLLVYLMLVSGKMIEVLLYRQMKYVTAFVMLLILYIPFATNNFNSYQAARAMVLMMPLLVSVVVVINTQKRIIDILRVYLILFVYLACFSLFYAGRGPGGAVGDENDLCLFMVTFLPMVFWLLGHAGGIKQRIVLWGVVCLGLISIVATFSRGGFVGLIAMASVYWFFSKKKIIFFMCGLLLGGFIYVYGGDDYRGDMSTIVDIQESTANERLLSWDASWRMFLDNPIGVGGGNFQVHFPDYQSAEHTRNMWGRVAHSLWFTLIPETGVVGIYLYFSLIFINLKSLFSMKRNKVNDKFFHDLSIAFLASFTAFFASATFISVLYYPMFWQLTALVVASRKVEQGY